MNGKEIRALGRANVEKELAAKQEELLRLNLRRRTGQIEKTHQFPMLRRTVARLQTVLNEKRVSGEES
jgi:large subunit ribosomal protein L29